MTKYTQGPWNIKRNGKAGKTFFIWRNDDHKQGLFKTGYDGPNENYTCIAQNVSTEANANLIAAAPELLEALQRYLLKENDLREPAVRTLLNAHAKTVIAKALGK